MRSPRLKDVFPSGMSALLAVIAAALLILSFPDLGHPVVAWFAPVPLIWAIDREKASGVRSFVIGWIFGILFFFGSCWWLTFAPITYAGFPAALAYFLLFCVTVVAGLFPAAFAAVLAVVLRSLGLWGFLATPFIWVAAEFARYWITGNNWNAIGYSQESFVPPIAQLGGVALVSFVPVTIATHLYWSIWKRPTGGRFVVAIGPAIVVSLLILFAELSRSEVTGEPAAAVVAVQPNVPMSGLDSRKWEQLRARQIEMAEAELQKLRAANNELPVTVILPESPMNFMYNDDREFAAYINDFARRNNVSVLFNSAEPDASNGRYFNSAVLVGSDGKKAEQYDKIYLLPFGEAVPLPLQNIVPAFVGTFSYGSEYDLVPLGDAKAGIMICFESHFGELSREYVRNGADVIIEMTNDGYLGPTPVLRQHLANAVLRAAETSRPVLRVTNVGITAYINERGQVLGPAESYSEATRVWTVPRSDGKKTLYVRFGDWFSWLCVMITVGSLIYGYRKRRRLSATAQWPISSSSIGS